MLIRRSIIFAATAALLATTAGSISAQPAQGIQWLERPSLRSDDYPVAALGENLSGEATIACSADAEGHPIDCRIESESPAGYGFGEAARTVVMRGRIDPSSLSDETGVFQLRIPFSVSVEAAPDVPDEARRQLDEGPSAMLRCRLTAARRAEDCVVVSESEPGVGIGARAIAIFQQAVLPQSMIDAIGVGNEVTVQVPLNPVSQ